MASCTTPKERPGAKEYRDISRIPENNEPERQRRFSALSVNKQIDAYLLAMCCVEPSDTSFLYLLSAIGSEKVLSIHDRIRQSRSSGDKVNLIRALVLIDDECRCVSRDERILESLDASMILDDGAETTAIDAKAYRDYLNELSTRNLEQSNNTQQGR